MLFVHFSKGIIISASCRRAKLPSGDHPVSHRSSVSLSGTEVVGQGIDGVGDKKNGDR